MEKENEKRCGVCKIPYFERNNYFYGKLMTVRDFFAEQCYFNEKRWLINRMVHGWGVVCGLDVTLKEGETDKVIVSPGLAIDCCGREILVCEEQEVQLEEEESECHKEKSKGEEGERKLVICLEFYECKTEALHLPPIACDQKEKCEFNRIRDSFKIRVIPESEVDIEAPYGKYCPLLEDKRKPLHGYLCEKLKEGCPECPERPCLVLAEIAIIPSSDSSSPPTIEIDQCSKRRLVYGNPVLFDLINCFHGDLPRITWINWIGNGAKIPFKKFEEGKACFTEEKYQSFLEEFSLNEEVLESLSCFTEQEYNNFLEEFPNAEGVLKEFKTIINDKTCIYPYRIPDDKKTELGEEALGEIMKHAFRINMNDRICIYPYKMPEAKQQELGEEALDEIMKETKSIYKDGVTVKFDREMNGDTINNNTFLFLVKMEESETGNYRYDQVPGDATYYIDNEDGKPTATFKIESAWLIDVYFGYSRIREKGGEFMVVLKSDFILSAEDNGKPAKALDGNFIGGELPSGNGTQGGDFVSWFYVEPPKTEEKKSRKSRRKRT